MHYVPFPSFWCGRAGAEKRSRFFNANDWLVRQSQCYLVKLSRWPQRPWTKWYLIKSLSPQMTLQTALHMMFNTLSKPPLVFIWGDHHWEAKSNKLPPCSHAWHLHGWRMEWKKSSQEKWPQWIILHLFSILPGWLMTHGPRAPLLIIYSLSIHAAAPSNNKKLTSVRPWLFLGIGPWPKKRGNHALAKAPRLLAKPTWLLNLPGWMLDCLMILMLLASCIQMYSRRM